ncbi:hypothetical protein MPSI1_001843 [Malassezia psittaci]|uniref:Uncharacterized protein n=1 Tax=Malassezia psittaci TaxID=1821823 RepID=A0AAF0F5H7_9BASI|nr:hypothetical protein MPSI1_001843 [Malassezia psittaci]
MTTPAITLNLSGAERQSFGNLFEQAKPNASGVITGDAAVKFFEGFKLPKVTLGKIWALADSDNNGYLTPNAFAAALRLIARAQRGESIGESEIQIQGAPPTYEGSSNIIPEPNSTSSSAGLIQPEDKARFSRIFASVGPVNGLLTGDQAKDVFMKSKLPIPKLGAIWNLADTKARGALDLTDFVIGMYYIQGTMNGTIKSIPTTLPPNLYEQASNAPAPPLQPQRTGTDHLAAAFGLPQSSPRKAPSLPGSSAPPPSMPTATSSAPAPTAAMPAQLRSVRDATGSRSSSQASFAPTHDWAISTQEKAKYDTFFDSLDTTKTGSIEGSLVVPFFMQSGLDEPTLAHVWDLSDLTQSGQLSRDEFALAMRLINDKLEGKNLPEQLPSSYVPPSLRSHDLPEAVDVTQSDTQKELFTLLDSDAPLMPASVAASAFNGGSSKEIGTTSTQFSSEPTPSYAPSASRDAQPASTQSSAFSTKPTVPSRQTTASFNPLDDDSDLPRSLQDNSKLTATQSTLDSTNEDLKQIQSRRSTAESNMSRNTTMLRDLEAQLSRARAQHQSETSAVRQLEERVESQNAEINSLRQEVIRVESELSAARTQKDELEQELLHGRESLREVQRQLSETQAESAKLREQQEQITKDIRQQSGANAIATKQLSALKAEQESLRSIPSGTAGADSYLGNKSQASATSMPTETVASPGGTRYNPFESFTVGAVAPVAEPTRSTANTFESQYGNFAEQTADTSQPQVDIDTSDDEQVQPEDLENNSGSRRQYLDSMNNQGMYTRGQDAFTSSQTWTEPESEPATEQRDSVSVPGGFPGEEDLDASSDKLSYGTSKEPDAPSLLPYETPSTQKGGASATSAGMPTGSIAMPPATGEPLEPPPASQPPPNVNKVERAPTTWSTVATAASTPVATPVPTGTTASSMTPTSVYPTDKSTPNAKTTSGLDDFDSAFANLGLAHVVHGAPSSNSTQPSATYDGFEEEFGSSFAGNTPKLGSSSPLYASRAEFSDAQSKQWDNSSETQGNSSKQRELSIDPSSAPTSYTTAASSAGLPTSVPSAPANGSQDAPNAPSAFANPLSYLSGTKIAPRADHSHQSSSNQGSQPAQQQSTRTSIQPGMPQQTESSQPSQSPQQVPNQTQSPPVPVNDAYGIATGRPPVVIGATGQDSQAASSPPPMPPRGTNAGSVVPGNTAAPSNTSSLPGAPPYPPASGRRSSTASGARAPSPALPDDVGPVRQLCQMGFARSQVVRALERCGYRTERALEHLLSNSGRA